MNVSSLDNTWGLGNPCQFDNPCQLDNTWQFGNPYQLDNTCHNIVFLSVERSSAISPPRPDVTIPTEESNEYECVTPNSSTT